jgi:hypothetical protein
VTHAELTVERYCSSVRDDEYNKTIINWGNQIHVSELDFLSKKPTKQQILQLQDNQNNVIKEWYEKRLETAWEADRKINQEYPENKFPTFARDMVDLGKILLMHVIDNGGSIIENRDWIYYECKRLMIRLN